MPRSAVEIRARNQAPISGGGAAGRVGAGHPLPSPIARDSPASEGSWQAAGSSDLDPRPPNTPNARASLLGAAVLVENQCLSCHVIDHLRSVRMCIYVWCPRASTHLARPELAFAPTCLTRASHSQPPIPSTATHWPARERLTPGPPSQNSPKTVPRAALTHPHHTPSYQPEAG